MSPFELYITYISWGSNGKYRPVLVILVSDEEVSLYPITTQYNKKSALIKKLYCRIEDWGKAGLTKLSYVDTGTLLCLPKSAIENKERIGKFSSKDKVRLLEFLQKKS